MSKKTIAIGADHGGVALKNQLAEYLTGQGHRVRDCGTVDGDAVDYPRYAYAVARLVSLRDCDVGIMIDGAGIGSCMTANKVRGVRAAACYNEALAGNAREHNDANVLTLGAGQTRLEQARKIVDIFLRTDCTEERHQRRVGLIMDVEKGALEAPKAPAKTAVRGDPEVTLSPEDARRVSERVRQLMAQSGIPGSGPINPGLTPARLAKYIDHTLLKPDASAADVQRLCTEAIDNGFYSVCVNSGNVRTAKNCLRGSDIKLCSVVGFPLGAMPPDIKAMETRKAVREGADEIDMVINVGALKSGDDKLVLDDIRAVAEACGERNVLLKVILETALLTDEEKVRACQHSMRAGANFVKTSTGFSSGGATVQDVALMYSVVAPKGLQVKASGGVRGYEDAIKMIEAGATRLGASSGIRIIEEARAVAEGRELVTDGKSKGAY